MEHVMDSSNWLAKEDEDVYLTGGGWSGDDSRLCQCYICAKTDGMLDITFFRERPLCPLCYGDDNVIRHVLESHSMEKEMRKMSVDKATCDKIMRELNEHCVNSILKNRDLKSRK